jgi:hypothetical protein
MAEYYVEYRYFKPATPTIGNIASVTVAAQTESEAIAAIHSRHPDFQISIVVVVEKKANAT